MRTARFPDSGGRGFLPTNSPGRNMGPGTETPWKEHGTRQPGSDIIQRTPLWTETPVKILPCPKLRLRAVKS